MVHMNNQGLTNLYGSVVFHIQCRLVLFLGAKAWSVEGTLLSPDIIVSHLAKQLLFSSEYSTNDLLLQFNNKLFKSFQSTVVFVILYKMIITDELSLNIE